MLCLTGFTASCIEGDPGVRLPEPDLTPLDPDFALEVRRMLTDARASHKQLTEKVSNLLASFAVVKPLDLVINEPYNLPASDLSSTDLAALLGTYTESPNVDGDFSNFIPSADGVTVVFNNGVKVMLTGLTYDADQKLTNLTLEVSSDVVTPAAQRVTMSFKETRAYRMNSFPFLRLRSLYMVGEVTMVGLDGIEETYYLNRDVVVYTTDPSQLLSHVESSRNSIQVLTPPGKSWGMSNILTYVPSDVPGKWAALGKVNTFGGGEVSYNTAITQYDPQSAGQATYTAGNGYVMFDGKVYATLTGGPYACELNAPDQLGSGTTIRMQYVDDAIEEVIPSAVFSCSQAVIADPTFP